MDDTLKTSADWQAEFPDTLVLDPDGWDRPNFDFSWFEELIPLGEYQRRLMYSTIQTKGPVHG